MTPSPLSRRTFFRTTGTAAVAATVASLNDRLGAADAATGTKGRVRHSVCKWCYPKIDLDTLCTAGKEMGLTSIDLLQPADFPTLKKHGLVCAMVANPTIKGADGKALGGIERAFNRKEHHDLLIQAYE